MTYAAAAYGTAPYGAPEGATPTAGEFPDIAVEIAFVTDPSETPKWVDVSEAVREVSINRGRQAELDTYAAGTATVVLGNEDRRFDPAAGAPAQYIDLPGTSGNYLSTPDSAALDVTDLDVRWEGVVDSFTVPAGAGNQEYFIGNYKHLTSGWKVYLTDTNTNLRFQLGATAVSHQVVNPFGDGDRIRLRVTRTQSDGVVTFYGSDDPTTAWEDLPQIGSAGAVSAGASAASSSPLKVGAGEGAVAFAGKVYYAEVRNGIDGPVVAKFDANTAPFTGTRTPDTVESETGETWTLNGSAWEWGGAWGSPHAGNLLPMRRLRIRATYNGVTYSLFSGFIDTWQQHYAPPEEATAVVTATDAFKVLAAAELPTSVYEAEVRADGPKAWWPLGEGTGTSTAFDFASGNAYDLTYVDATLGGDSVVVRDPGSSALFEESTSRAERPGSVITGFPFSIEAFFQKPPLGALEEGWIYTQDFGGDTRLVLQVGEDGGPSGCLAFFIEQNGSTSAFVNTTFSVADNAPHHVVVTASSSSDIRLFVDGVDVTDVDTTSTDPFPSGSYRTSVGGDVDIPDRNFKGNLQHVAVYDYVLPPARIAAHNAAGRNPWRNDTVGQRAGRILDEIGWPDTERDLDEGEASPLQSASLNTSALAYLQKLADSEGGALYIGPNGDIRLRARSATWNTDTLYTFGEDDDDQEYLGVTFDYSETYVHNDIRVSRADGVVHRAQDTESQRKYLRRSLVRNGLLYSDDEESRDAANWLLARYKDPELRVTGMTVQPFGGNPEALFPVVLGVDLGARIRVKRRPQQLGVAIDQDALVEGIQHSFSAARWVTTYRLSPAGAEPVLQLDAGTPLGSSKLAY